MNVIKYLHDLEQIAKNIILIFDPIEKNNNNKLY